MNEASEKLARWVERPNGVWLTELPDSCTYPGDDEPEDHDGCFVAEIWPEGDDYFIVVQHRTRGPDPGESECIQGTLEQAKTRAEDMLRDFIDGWLEGVALEWIIYLNRSQWGEDWDKQR